MNVLAWVGVYMLIGYADAVVDERLSYKRWRFDVVNILWPIRWLVVLIVVLRPRVVCGSPALANRWLAHSGRETRFAGIAPPFAKSWAVGVMYYRRVPSEQKEERDA